MRIFGTAARFGEVFYPGNWYGIGLELAPSAFDDTMSQSPHVALLAEHEGLPLAATIADKAPLTLAVDSDGLHYDGTIADDQADSVLVWQKVDSGLMVEASFAAGVVDGDWVMRDGEEVFRATSMDLNGGDVSVVRMGANPDTGSETKSASRMVASQSRKGLVKCQRQKLKLVSAVLSRGGGK